MPASHHFTLVLTPQGNVVEFAEKPKGDALKGMRVDTTVLGVDPQT